MDRGPGTVYNINAMSVHRWNVSLDGAFTALKLIKKAQLHVFPNCGHWAQIEAAEEFAAVATQFLARHDERGFEARSARTSTTEPPVEVRAPASLETRGGAS